MRDPVPLRVHEPGQRALEDTEHLRQLERSDERPQRAARDVLHRDVGNAVVFEEVEQRHDVRVVERRRQPRLAHEALGERGVVALEVEALEDDLAIECRLADQVHDGHPAPGEHPDDLVAADALTAQRNSGATLSGLGLARASAAPDVAVGFAA